MIGLVKAKVPFVQFQVVPEGIVKAAVPDKAEACVIIGMAGAQEDPSMIMFPIILMVPVPLKLPGTLMMLVPALKFSVPLMVKVPLCVMLPPLVVKEHPEAIITIPLVRLSRGLVKLNVPG